MGSFTITTTSGQDARIVDAFGKKLATVDGNGDPRHLDLTPEEAAALVAFMKTLTDYELINDIKFSNPFVD